jgi:multiple sugar transport system permease protein
MSGAAFANGWSKYLALAVLLTPSLIGMSVFVIGPILGSLALSFTSWDMFADIEWIGLANYAQAIGDPAVHTALGNTMLFILGYLPPVVCIGLGLALLLNRAFPGQTLFRAIYFVPVVTSWVAVSLVWKWLLNPEFGLVNYGLSLLGIAGPGWLYDPQWAMAGIVLTSVWKDVGFVMVIYLAGLQDIPETLYEAAEIDGIHPLRVFWRITLPLLAPTTFFVTTISLINSFQVFDQVWIMTEGGPAGATSVVMELIYKNAFRYYQMGYASAISWLLFAIIFCVTIAQNLMQRRLEPWND